jgi:hypothetical protein
MFFFEIINSLGNALGVQISNMGENLSETRVDSRNRTRAAALTAGRLATGPTSRSLCTGNLVVSDNQIGLNLVYFCCPKRQHY